MTVKRITTLVIALAIALISYLMIVSRYDFILEGNFGFIVKLFLAIFFLAMMVSNQQFEENILSKIERVVSVLLFSFIIFFQLIYAPLANYFFKTLITKSFFLTDILALLFFILFLALFFITFFTLNSFARFGLLADWIIFNNEKAFFILRSLWLTGAIIIVYLYLKSPFIIID
jgi:hypothetical protein